MTKPAKPARMIAPRSLAERIVEASAVSHGTALAALQAGGRTREFALSILESETQYEQDLKRISDARQRLREAGARC